MSVELLNAFVTLLLTVDPIGVAPFFLALTRDLAPAERRRAAARGVVIAAIVLAGFAVGGHALLVALGISVHALKVSGGVLLFLIAIDMVFARQFGPRELARADDTDAGVRYDISIFPLAIPMIAGPGSITSILLLMNRAEGNPRAQATVLGLLLVVMVLSYASLRTSAWLVGILGTTGASVVSRVLGILLAALAAQFVLDGLAASFRS